MPRLPAPRTAGRAGGVSIVVSVFAGVIVTLAAAAVFRAWRPAPAPLSPRDRLEADALAAARSEPGDAALGAQFAALNRDHFQNRLGSVRVVWSPALRTIGPLIQPGFMLQGLTDGRVIMLNPDLEPEPADVTRVLCHEMVHVSLIASGASRAEHGPAFQEELKRLADERAFEGIPATADERAATKARLLDEARAIEVTRSELDSLNSQLDTRASELKAQSEDFNQRMAAANERQSGWPPPEERESILQRQNDLNDEGASYNDRVREFNDDVRRFNEDARRYNLMLVYPDGLDLQNAVAEQRTRGGRG